MKILRNQFASMLGLALCINGLFVGLAARQPNKKRLQEPAPAVKETPQESLILNKHILQQTIKKLDLEIPIRVLLDEQGFCQDVKWKLGAQGGFLVYSTETRQKTIYQKQTILITCKGGSFYINDVKQPSQQIFIIPLNGPVLFKKNVYDGVLALNFYKDVAYLVNHLDLEEYVLSVLPYESCPEWPDEVHKAFCIAFRSYGIAKVLEARAQHAKSGSLFPYDIKNTNAHQIYKGRSHTSRFKNIVDETKGVVLVGKDQKPVLAMFDICCGGVPPALKKGINFNKAPHLKRTYPCTFCKEYKYYRWSCTYSFEEVEKAVQKEIPHLGYLRDIKVSSYDNAEVAQEIRIRGTQWHTVSAAKFKSCFKDLRSLCFKIQKNGRSITITGKGHGHHMGLCQRGAYSMVVNKKRKQRDVKHRDILKFYYPHTTFVKLQKIDY